MATQAKIAAIDDAFSHPGGVPKFVDTDEVLRGTERMPGTNHKAICVNPRSVERALAAQATRGPVWAWPKPRS